MSGNVVVGVAGAGKAVVREHHEIGQYPVLSDDAVRVSLGHRVQNVI